MRILCRVEIQETPLFHMIKLDSTLRMPIKVSNYIFGTNCQWHPSSSKVTPVKLAAWDQIVGHCGVVYHKLYVFPHKKCLLELFSTYLYPFIFESFPWLYIILEFKGRTSASQSYYLFQRDFGQIQKQVPPHHQLPIKEVPFSQCQLSPQIKDFCKLAT